MMVQDVANENDESESGAGARGAVHSQSASVPSMYAPCARGMAAVVADGDMATEAAAAARTATVSARFRISGVLR